MTRRVIGGAVARGYGFTVMELHHLFLVGLPAHYVVNPIDGVIDRQLVDS